MKTVVSDSDYQEETEFESSDCHSDDSDYQLEGTPPAPRIQKEREVVKRKRSANPASISTNNPSGKRVKGSNSTEFAVGDDDDSIQGCDKNNTYYKGKGKVSISNCVSYNRLPVAAVPPTSSATSKGNESAGGQAKDQRFEAPVTSAVGPNSSSSVVGNTGRSGYTRPKKNKIQAASRAQSVSDEEDEDEDEEKFAGSFLNHFGSIVNAKLQAKRNRIEKNFRIVETPKIFLETSKTHSRERIQKDKNCEDALNNFRARLDAIRQKHDGAVDLFQRMFRSIHKGQLQIKTDIIKIQKQVETCVQNMNETANKLHSELAKSETEAMEKFETEVENWKANCLSTIEKEAMGTVESLGNVIQFI